MTGFRTTQGGLIDRTRQLRFTFDGRACVGHPGDTLVSALLANGVRVLGRGFKYHRPRGAWGAWFDDPNAIFNVTLNGVELTNCPGAMTQLQDGMALRAVNTAPTARRDIKGALDGFSRFLSAGFYYKTFMWPDWHIFEPAIRRMAGLGTFDGREIPDYGADQTHARCDLLVVGGGPAGLVAACAAAEQGADVVLVDDHPQVGGSAFQQAHIEAVPAQDWVASRLARLQAAGGRVLSGTTAFGVYDHRLVALAQDRGFAKAPRLIRMRARRCLLATGAIDRPVTFAMNDRPGVMSLTGAVELWARYGVLVGRHMVVMAPNSAAPGAVARLREAGATVDVIPEIIGTPEAMGRRSVTGLRVDHRTWACDTILTSAGLMPVVHLWSHAGGKLAWDDAAAAFLPGVGPDWMQAIGAANGCFALEDALAEAAAVALGQDRPERRVPYHASPPVPQDSPKRQWIDMQHDVTFKDIALAARENYASVEHLKRYTTLGMASDQGKTSNVAGLSVLAALRGKAVAEVGTTTFRPPFVPVPLELYRGAHRAQQVHPLKRLALELRHRAAGAALGEYGGWLRPAWYGADKGRIAEEVRMSREAAAIFDASPLGKIEVMGPDAEAFVNFVFYNTIRTLAPGRIRYALMLTESGIVFDDGVIARLGPDRFVVSCSSSHVDGVSAALEAWRQDGNDPDRIFVHDTTPQWATVTVVGPKARRVLDRLELGCNLSAEALPHMALCAGRFDGAPMRISRVSFTGDPSFEVSVPAAKAGELWDALIAAGVPDGAGPMGLEALSILRAEKGYIVVGRETDGTTMPHDLGFGGPRLRKTAAFVGDRALHSEAAQASDRYRLVGLRVPEGAPPLDTGAHLVVTGEGGARRSVGYVTSSYDSPTLGHAIALARLAAPLAETGQKVTVFHLGATRDATVCPPCFLDPQGERLNA